jgi:hypothetical protein
MRRLRAKHVAAAAVLALLVHCQMDYAYVRSYVDHEVPAGSDPETCALSLAAAIHADVPQVHEDPYFIVPALSPLGASPTSVLKQGGCCSGITRLYILGLATQGIRASQVTLYHESGRAVHCLSEVTLPSGKLIVDPTYGFCLSGRNGEGLSIEQLQQGATPSFYDFKGREHTGYPGDDYYHFDYRLTKTANWTKSWIRRSAYRVLHATTAGGVDRLRLHPLLEWPQVLMTFPFLLLLVCRGRPAWKPRGPAWLARETGEGDTIQNRG